MLQDVLTTLGLKGSAAGVALAGAAGGLVRWLTLRSHPIDGVISIVVGAILAVYAGPLAEPLINGLLGGVIVEPERRASFGGFLIGLGGVTISGFLLDYWRARKVLGPHNKDKSK